MQNVATEKSSVAALPHKLELDLGQPQAGSNELFRSLFHEAQPNYRQPVEPKVREVQRQEQPTSHSSKAADAERRASHSRSEKGAQSDSNAHATNTKQTPETQGKQENSNDSLASERSEQIRSDAEKEAASASSRRTVESSDSSDSQSKADISQESEKLAKDKPNGETSDLDEQENLTDAATHEKNEITVAHNEQEAAQEIDWLALLEGLRAVELGSKSKQDAGVSANGTDTSIDALLTQGQNAEEILLDSIGMDKEQLRKLLESVEAVIARLPRESGEVSDAQAIQLALSLSGIQHSADTEQEMPLVVPEIELENSLAPAGAREVETVGEVELQELEAALEALFIALNGQQNEGQSSAEVQGAEQLELTSTGTDVNSEIESNDAIAAEILDTMVQQSNSESPSEDKVEPLDVALVAALLKASANESSSPAKRSEDVSKAQEQIQGLLKLNDPQLEAALSNLAERALQLREQTSSVDEAQLSNIITLNAATEGMKKDFVASLKAGLEEIKAQLKQGHVSAIDLKALVAQSLEALQQPQPSAESLTQMTGQFSAALDLSAQLNQQGHSATLVSTLDKIALKESAQTANQQVKQVQQQMGQFDKAVNITRAEGHQQFVEKVRWMVNQNQLQADIRLDPPDLGSMKVRVNLSGESASVNIVVQSQQAKEALEQATPRLKELLEEQGIALGQSSVEQEQHHQQQQGTGAMASSARADQGVGELNEGQAEIVEQPIRNGRLGGIDYFV